MKPNNNQTNNDGGWAASLNGVLLTSGHATQFDAMREIRKGAPHFKFGPAVKWTCDGAPVLNIGIAEALSEYNHPRFQPLVNYSHRNGMAASDAVIMEIRSREAVRLTKEGVLS